MDTLGYLNSLEAPRWDGGRSSDNGINCPELGKQLNVLWKKNKQLFLGFSSGLFMEGAPALWSGAWLVGRASLPSWESHVPCFNDFWWRLWVKVRFSIVQSWKSVLCSPRDGKEMEIVGWV